MHVLRCRVWDKTRKEWLSAGRVFIAIGPGSSPENNIYLDIVEHVHKDLYKDRFVIVWSTGLHDRHRKEIWEGDKWREYDWGGKSYDGVIIYEPEDGAFMADMGRLGKYYLKGRLLSGEVIGNIYEGGK